MSKCPISGMDVPITQLECPSTKVPAHFCFLFLSLVKLVLVLSTISTSCLTPDDAIFWFFWHQILTHGSLMVADSPCKGKISIPYQGTLGEGDLALVHFVQKEIGSELSVGFINSVLRLCWCRRRCTNAVLVLISCNINCPPCFLLCLPNPEGSHQAETCLAGHQSRFIRPSPDPPINSLSLSYFMLTPSLITHDGLHQTWPIFVQDALPMCVVTGRHMVKEDWCICPRSRMPALLSHYESYLQYEQVGGAWAHLFKTLHVL